MLLRSGKCKMAEDSGNISREGGDFSSNGTGVPGFYFDNTMLQTIVKQACEEVVGTLRSDFQEFLRAQAERDARFDERLNKQQAESNNKFVNLEARCDDLGSAMNVIERKCDSDIAKLKGEIRKVQDDEKNVIDECKELVLSAENTFTDKFNGFEEEQKARLLGLDNRINGLNDKVTEVVDKDRKDVKEIRSRVDKCCGEINIYREDMENILAKSGTLLESAHEEIRSKTENWTEELAAAIGRIRNVECRLTGMENQRSPTTDPGNVLMDIQLPKFTEKAENCPRHFLRDLEMYFRVKRVPNEFKILLLKQSADENVARWMEVSFAGIKTYEEAKDLFVKKFWSSGQQAEITRSFYEGWYDPRRGQSMTEYFLKMAIHNQELDRPLDEKDFINEIATHFERDIGRHLGSANINTIEEVLNFLQVQENIDKKQTGMFRSRTNFQERTRQSPRSPTYTSAHDYNYGNNVGRDSHRRNYQFGNNNGPRMLGNRDEGGGAERDTRRPEPGPSGLEARRGRNQEN